MVNLTSCLGCGVFCGLLFVTVPSESWGSVELLLQHLELDSVLELEVSISRTSARKINSHIFFFLNHTIICDIHRTPKSNTKVLQYRYLLHNFLTSIFLALFLRRAVTRLTRIVRLTILFHLFIFLVIFPPYVVLGRNLYVTTTKKRPLLVIATQKMHILFLSYNTQKKSSRSKVCQIMN